MAHHHHQMKVFFFSYRDWIFSAVFNLWKSSVSGSNISKDSRNIVYYCGIGIVLVFVIFQISFHIHNQFGWKLRNKNMKKLFQSNSRFPKNKAQQTNFNLKPQHRSTCCELLSGKWKECRDWEDFSRWINFFYLILALKLKLRQFDFIAIICFIGSNSRRVEKSVLSRLKLTVRINIISRTARFLRCELSSLARLSMPQDTTAKLFQYLQASRMVDIFRANEACRLFVFDS